MTIEIKQDYMGTIFDNYLKRFYRADFLRFNDGDVSVIVTNDKKIADLMEETYNKSAGIEGE